MHQERPEKEKSKATPNPDLHLDTLTGFLRRGRRTAVLTFRTKNIGTVVEG